MITITKACPFCGKVQSMNFDKATLEEGMKKRNSGMRIQDAFPMYTPSQREFLMTGICDSCWDNM